MRITLAAISKFKTMGLLACLLLSGCARTRPDPAAVKQQLTAAVPLQSTQTQVLDYLNRQKIDHSPYRYDQDKGNSIDAAIFVKSTRNLVDPTYSVEFRFDKHDRLIDCDVQWLGYIPI
jgi:hypothetical protein